MPQLLAGPRASSTLPLPGDWSNERRLAPRRRWRGRLQLSFGPPRPAPGDVSTAPAGQRCREVCCGHGNGNVWPPALCRPARPLLDHTAAVCARPTLFQRHRCTTPPRAARCCPCGLVRGGLPALDGGFAVGSTVVSTGVGRVSSYRPLGLASLFGSPLPRGHARCSIALAGRPGRPLLVVDGAMVLVGFCRVMPTMRPHVPCPRASCKPLEPVTATAVSVFCSPRGGTSCLLLLVPRPDAEGQPRAAP